jgi:hypothetical protein
MHGGLVAKSANGGSEHARAVASMAVWWPSSWMTEAIELGCDRCFCVQWRLRNMCLMSEVKHGWRWWCAVEHGWWPPHSFISAAIVLFDFGASHSFISAAYVEKHNLPLALLKCQMIVSSLGGDMPVRQLCPKVNLKIRGG